MRFQLLMTGWPLQGGRSFIPAGTIIDSSATDGWSALVVALGITQPPMNAMPLNQATYDLMRQQFAAWQIVTVPGADGINRT